MPAPQDDGEEGGSASKRAKGSGGAVVGRWQEQVSRSASHKELRAAAAAGTATGGAKSGDTGSTSPGGSGSATKLARKPRDPNVVEVLRFTKYFHLVPAQVCSSPDGPNCGNNRGKTIYPKKAKCKVPWGVVHIQASLNNTISIITTASVETIWRLLSLSSPVWEKFRAALVGAISPQQ